MITGTHGSRCWYRNCGTDAFLHSLPLHKLKSVDSRDVVVETVLLGIFSEADCYADGSSEKSSIRSSSNCDDGGSSGGDPRSHHLIWRLKL